MIINNEITECIISGLKLYLEKTINDGISDMNDLKSKLNNPDYYFREFTVLYVDEVLKKIQSTCKVINNSYEFLIFLQGKTK